MSGRFGHAKPLVDGVGAAVDGEHVEDQVLAFLPASLMSALMSRAPMARP